MARNKFPVVEGYPTDYNGYKFVSLIVYNQRNFLVIVDNVVDNNVYAYVLDWCPLYSIDETVIRDLAKQWFEEHYSIPFSFFVSAHNMTEYLQPLYTSFSISNIERIVGAFQHYPITTPLKIKHKKKNKALKGN